MTVRSNSLIQFRDHGSGLRLHLADLNGDGLAEWVAYNTHPDFGYKILAASTAFTGQTHVQAEERGRIAIRGLYSGRFHHPHKESICLYLDGPALPDGRILGYELSSENKFDLWLDQPAHSPALPFFSNPSRVLPDQVVVGDFDGDQLDEILLYSSRAGEFHLIKFQVTQLPDGDFNPIRRFTLGNLSNQAEFRDCMVWVGNFGDWPGEGRRDDLLIYNRNTRQIRRFDSRVDSGGNTTFWWAFHTHNDYVSPDEQISVADVNGDGLEEVVLYNRSTGDVRFLSMSALNSRSELEAINLNQGQIPRERNVDGMLFWGLLKSFPGEGGNTNRRDDVFVYNPSSRALRRFDARWSGAEQTYWWAYDLTIDTITSRYNWLFTF